MRGLATVSSEAAFSDMPSLLGKVGYIEPVPDTGISSATKPNETAALRSTGLKAKPAKPVTKNNTVKTTNFLISFTMRLVYPTSIPISLGFCIRRYLYCGGIHGEKIKAQAEVSIKSYRKFATFAADIKPVIFYPIIANSLLTNRFPNY